MARKPSTDRSRSRRGYRTTVREPENIGRDKFTVARVKREVARDLGTVVYSKPERARLVEAPAETKRAEKVAPLAAPVRDIERDKKRDKRPVQALEKIKTCKEKPRENRKGSGKGARRSFVPWCNKK